VTEKPGVGIRLFMAGGDLVRSTFAQIGDAGKRMWAELALGSEKANPALKGLSQASKEAQAYVGNLAAEAGPAGRILSAMGPAGIAAAAGIGLMAIALRTLTVSAFESIERLDDLSDAAAGLDIGIDMAVRYGLALEAAGGKQDNLIAGLGSFQSKAGEFLSGLSGEDGPFGKALGLLGITASFKEAQSLEEQLLLVADAIALVEDSAERAALAEKLGLAKLLPLLERGSGEVRELTGQFDQMARATADAAREADPLAARLATANARMTTAANIISVRLGPALVGLKEAMAGVLEGLSLLVGGGANLEDGLARSLAAVPPPDEAVVAALEARNRIAEEQGRLESTLADLRQQQERSWNGEVFDERIALMEVTLEKTNELRRRSEQELAAAEAAAARRRSAPPFVAADPADLEDKPRSETAEALRAAAAAADRAAADAAADAARATDAAARSLDSALEKSRGALGAYLAELDELAEAAALLPGRQDDIRTATAAAGQAYLEAAAKAAGLSDGLKALEARDPAAIATYADHLADLAAQRDSYPGGSAAFTAALEAETRAFLDAAAGADQAAKARAAFDTLMGQLATPQERAGEERAEALKILNDPDLVLSADAYAEALQRIEDRYNGVAAAQGRAAQSGEGWMTIIEGISEKGIELEDILIKLGQRILELTAMDFLGGKNKGDFLGALGGALGDLFGFGGGSGGGSGGGYSLPGWLTGGVHHAGYGPGDRIQSSLLPSWIWDSAPRHHDGYLAPNERAAILRNDESVLTPGQMRTLASMGGSGDRGAVAPPRERLLITLRDESGGRLQAEPGEGPDGMQLDVLVRDTTRSSLATGAFDAQMAQRYGLKPRTT
jgi:hypothetical protein